MKDRNTVARNIRVQELSTAISFARGTLDVTRRIVQPNSSSFSINRREETVAMIAFGFDLNSTTHFDLRKLNEKVFDGK